jgi:hypothetical protein
VREENGSRTYGKGCQVRHRDSCLALNTIDRKVEITATRSGESRGQYNVEINTEESLCRKKVVENKWVVSGAVLCVGKCGGTNLAMP